jgi:hypothetical protein
MKLLPASIRVPDTDGIERRPLQAKPGGTPHRLSIIFGAAQK